MRDITSKTTSLRRARATATLLLSREETAQAIRDRKVPKGDVFEFARAAALLAIKNTSAVIPDCHPLPIEAAHMQSELQGLSVRITVEVQAIYRTGVEIEALHGAMIGALTMLDMLKPIDPKLQITDVKLEEKTGGKTGHAEAPQGLRTAVIVCSDRVSQGLAEDTSGKSLALRLEEYGCKNVYLETVPDEVERIRACTQALIKQGVDLVLFTGGTGLSPRDVTPEAVKPLIEREVPGMMEAARKHGQERTPCPGSPLHDRKEYPESHRAAVFG